MFLNKIDICKNKPNWKKQKFVTVVTKLWHCDEIRRFDGTVKIIIHKEILNTKKPTYLPRNTEYCDNNYSQRNTEYVTVKN
jgi:hypothetical protein